MSEEKPKEKRCTKCGEVKALEEFCRDRRRKDSRRAYCKKCNAEQSRRYYEQDPEKARERHLRWYNANPEKVKKQSRRYYEQNREKVIGRQLRYYEQNRDADIREILGMRDLLKALEDEVPPPEDEETTEPEIDPGDEDCPEDEEE